MYTFCAVETGEWVEIDSNYPKMSMQCDDSELEQTAPSLTELPIEVILHILQYLNVRFITEVLAEVSTLFR